MKIKSTALILFLGFCLFISEASASNFDPNNIISDQEMLDSDSMTLAEIEIFLRNQNGYISKNIFPNFSGQTKTAAQIIYDAASAYDCGGTNVEANAPVSIKQEKCQKISINPKFLIVLLQKEQSLITDKSPTQSQLDWATGYGCPDGGGCNDRWRGFGKQVNSASLQFYDYIKNPQNYGFRAGQTYTVSNTGRPSQQVTPANNATAGLYNYTPHVYNGNFNFYNLWMRFFTFSYPNNTLLQVKGEAGVWLIQNGVKRPFLTRGALTSRYDLKKVVQVSKTIIDKYPKGAPIKFAQYSLIQNPKGTIYLLVDDTKRGIESTEAFRKIGFNPEEVLSASWEDVNSYSDGKPITATSSYPTGALLQDSKSGGIYYVTEGTKAPLWDRSLLKTKFRWKSITKESPEKLAGYKTVEPAIFNDGELLKSANSPAVFAIDNKKKRPINSGELFEKLGYSWNNIIIVPQKILDLYEDGDPLKDSLEEAQVFAEPIASSSPSQIATGTKESISATSSDPEIIGEMNNVLNP